jgi:hypothetical protein
MGAWVGVTPQLGRIPQQLVLLVFIWLALAGLSRLRLPRWSLAVVTGILALDFLALRTAYAGKAIRVVVHANHVEVTGPAFIFLGLPKTCG